MDRTIFIIASTCFMLFSKAVSAQGFISWDWANTADEPFTADPVHVRPPGLALSLELKARAETLCDHITLADLASCQGGASLCAQISGIVIAGAPVPGQTLKISAGEIAAVLSQEEPDFQVSLSGAEQLTVFASAQVAEPQELEQAFRSKLLEVASAATDVQVQAISLQVLHKWQVRPGPYHYEFDLDLESILPSRSRPSFNAHRPVTVKARHVPQNACASPQTMDVLVKLELKKQQWVAKKSLPAQSAFYAEDFELDWQPLASSSSSSSSLDLQDLSLYSGYTLRHSLVAGRVLTAAALQPPLLVARGARVSMGMGAGAFALTALVQAKQAGYKDSVIDVVYEPTRKTMKALVVGKDKVVVLE